MDAMKNALAFQWVQAKVRKSLFYIEMQSYLYTMIAISICRRLNLNIVSDYSQIETVTSLLRLCL